MRARRPAGSRRATNRPHREDLFIRHRSDFVGRQRDDGDGVARTAHELDLDRIWGQHEHDRADISRAEAELGKVTGEDDGVELLVVHVLLVHLVPLAG